MKESNTIKIKKENFISFNSGINKQNISPIIFNNPKTEISNPLSHSVNFGFSISNSNNTNKNFFNRKNSNLVFQNKLNFNNLARSHEFTEKNNLVNKTFFSYNKQNSKKIVLKYSSKNMLKIKGKTPEIERRNVIIKKRNLYENNNIYKDLEFPIKVINLNKNLSNVNEMENNYFRKSMQVLNTNFFNKYKNTLKTHNHNDSFGNELNIIKLQLDYGNDDKNNSRNNEIKNDLSHNFANNHKIKLKPIEKNINNNLPNKTLSNEIKFNSNKKINILNNNIKMNSMTEGNTNKDKTQEEKTDINLQKLNEEKELKEDIKISEEKNSNNLDKNKINNNNDINKTDNKDDKIKENNTNEVTEKINSNESNKGNSELKSFVSGLFNQSIPSKKFESSVNLVNPTANIEKTLPVKKSNDDMDFFSFTNSIFENANKIIKNGNIKNFSSFTQSGKTEEGPKINQDSFIELESINNNPNFHIFGVFDGHGSQGHLISQFMVNTIKNLILNDEKLKEISKHTNQIYSLLIENNYEYIKNLISKSEELLFKNENIDSNFSGSTCILIILIDKKVLSANIGDSRAIMVKGHKTIIELSSDQKPENELEKERILSKGGEIRQLIENNEPIGPMRVFLPNENYPGIAMARSIGDKIASSIGVFSEPEIKEFDIESNCKYIIIGSDGVYEFLSNEKIAHYANKYYKSNNAKECTEVIVKKSTDLWIKYDTVIDDITIIVIFFN